MGKLELYNYVPFKAIEEFHSIMCSRYSSVLQTLIDQVHI